MTTAVEATVKSTVQSTADHVQATAMMTAVHEAMSDTACAMLRGSIAGHHCRRSDKGNGYGCSLQYSFYQVHANLLNLGFNKIKKAPAVAGAFENVTRPARSFRNLRRNTSSAINRRRQEFPNESENTAM